MGVLGLVGLCNQGDARGFAAADGGKADRRSEMFVAEAIDFPVAVTQGFDLPDARLMIASALEDPAQILLEEGKSLPVPSEAAHSGEADLIELVPLSVHAGFYNVPADQRLRATFRLTINLGLRWTYNLTTLHARARFRVIRTGFRKGSQNMYRNDI